MRAKPCRWPRPAWRRRGQQAAAAHALVAGVPLAQNPAVLAASTAYQDAWLTLHRTAVVAPTGGYIAQRSVQLGQAHHAGRAPS